MKRTKFDLFYFIFTFKQWETNGKTTLQQIVFVFLFSISFNCPLSTSGAWEHTSQKPPFQSKSFLSPVLLLTPLKNKKGQTWKNGKHGKLGISPRTFFICYSSEGDQQINFFLSFFCTSDHTINWNKPPSTNSRLFHIFNTLTTYHLECDTPA